MFNFRLFLKIMNKILQLKIFFLVILFKYKFVNKILIFFIFLLNMYCFDNSDISPNVKLGLFFEFF
jgi:hypothetical protein